MRHLIRMLGVMLATVGLVGALGASASAAPSQPAAIRPAASPSEPEPITEFATVSAERNAVSRDVERLSRHLQTSESGVVSLDSSAALRAGVSKQRVDEFAKGLALANAEILANPRLATACRGVNRYVSHWYGPELRLDSCNANSFRILLQGGAALSTIAAAILALSGLGLPAGAAVALAGGMIALGSVAFSWCNRDNRGVRVYKLAYIGPFYCTQQ
ncbi:MAG: hypothetical protein ACRCYX_03285 [Dermatophilaceae bacterium]